MAQTLEMFKLQFHPTAGFLPNIADGAGPGRIRAHEIALLRDLAAQVKTIAAEDEYRTKRERWFDHTALVSGRPMVLVFPEDSWFEMLPPAALEVSDPFWRQWEWYFRHLLYRHDKLHDDFVVEPEIVCAAVTRNTGWGLEAEYSKTTAGGSYIWQAPIKDEADLEKLSCPQIEVDEGATEERFGALNEVLGDILPVSVQSRLELGGGVVATAAVLRGMEQVMLDMYDRPEWLHRLLQFITDSYLRIMDNFEKNNLLSLNNRNHYTDSGGIGYTRELPAADFDGSHVRLKDLWGRAAAQEYSEVSPDMHEEFGLKYQMQLLDKFGLVAYGCCEPYTRKFDMVKQIPTLRRVSVSPWCDVAVAADQLEDRYIYSWKPNPAYLAGGYNEDVIRTYIRSTLDATRDCVVEMILKDTYTIENDPKRMTRWTEIAQEEIARIYD